MTGIQYFRTWKFINQSLLNLPSEESRKEILDFCDFYEKVMEVTHYDPGAGRILNSALGELVDGEFEKLHRYNYSL